MNRNISLPFLLLTVTFCVCLIVSNLMEVKVVDLGFMTITAGVVVFPLSYIINDCIVEVYGFRKARLAIWLGFAMNALVTLFLQIGLWLPGSADAGFQEALSSVYGAVPRITVASFIAFVSGSMVNAFVMSRMKARSGARNFSLRAIVSTLWGEGTDSLIFFPIAFAGVLPWSAIVSLIVTQALLKTAYEIVILPVTVAAVRRLKRLEGGCEVIDRDISYRWWRVNEI
ncbi:MAG: queuosine precursor transporter [Pseudoflavonifractor sp.]|nr:queuosine precursor transporter [Pseudoflavonifractor sp.]